MPCNGHDHQLLLRRMFDCAVEAVSAKRVVPDYLPQAAKGRTVLLAVGKAASAMADVVATEWTGPLSGLVVTRYGHILKRTAGHADIEVIEARHPIPDGMSVVGARRAMALVQGLSADDLVLVLISGGGSSLWCLPIDGVSLEDKQDVTTALLSAGATIQDLNTVRIGLSQIKGGKLAQAAWPARVETLIISDVVSNDPSLIASGPTVPSSVTAEDVEKILARYSVDVPAHVRDALNRSSRPASEKGSNRSTIVAVPTDALRAAEQEALLSGFAVRMLGDTIEGEARDAALAHAAVAREAAAGGKPTIILSGGEVTVAVRDKSGIGGPNTEFLLALALALDGAPDIYALACDTDGYDGVGNNAGAMIGPDTLNRARQKNIDPAEALATNNSYRFFEALGDLVVTGPTQTNVSDFRAILICGGNPGS
ncbi:MAG TPA: glycerate kinase [Woeseiaceae bacterium]|nr:glycerate kinase [Woeseiaceae bacterium]